ncbi:hypothetical protein Hanom_Chr10g00898831 [Helianthus anomalus]
MLVNLFKKESKKMYLNVPRHFLHLLSNFLPLLCSCRNQIRNNIKIHGST